MYNALRLGAEVTGILGNVRGVVAACAKEMVQWTWPRLDLCVRQRRV